MSPLDRLLALRGLAAFRSLGPATLRAVAESTRLVEGQPGERLVSAGATLGQLVVVVRGSLRSGEGPEVGPVLGLGSLLFDRPVRIDLIADTEAGCTLLLVPRSLVFSLVHDYPDFCVSLLGRAYQTRLYEPHDTSDASTEEGP